MPDNIGTRYTESDIERGREIARINALSREECPNCGEPLEHFSGLEGIPAYRYCPRCMDVGYDDDGNQIVTLE
jgi:ribosomal protein S27AE